MSSAPHAQRASETRVAETAMEQEPAETAAPPPVWARHGFCPEGTSRVGMGPPEDIEVRCERPDRTLHGPYRLWWQNGQKRVEAHYIEGLEHGGFAEWDEDGSDLLSGSYQQGLRHGQWSEPREGGYLLRTSYERGLVTSRVLAKGETVVSDIASTPLGERWWKGEAPCPVGTTLDGKGKAGDELDIGCKTDGGLSHGPATSWHQEYIDYHEDPDAGPERILGVSSRGRFRYGLRHGPWLERNEKGKKLLDSNWRDGIPDGTWTYYDKRGRKKASIARDAATTVSVEMPAMNWWTAPDAHCPEGTRHDSHTSYDGKTSHRCLLPDDSWHGPYALLKGDRLIGLGRYRDQKLHGQQLRFDKEGLQSIQSYHLGEKHGLSRQWRYVGSERRLESYSRNGQTYVERQVVGDQLLSLHQFRRGRRHGTTTDYHETGVVKSKETWIDGRQHGPTYRWYQDGRPQAMELYEHGRKVGTWKTWAYYNDSVSDLTHEPPEDLALLEQLEPIKAQPSPFPLEAHASFRNALALLDDLEVKIRSQPDCDKKAAVVAPWLEVHRETFMVIRKELEVFGATTSRYFLHKLSMSVLSPFADESCKKHPAFDRASLSLFNLGQELAR